MWFDYLVGSLFRKGRPGFRRERRFVQALSDVSFTVDEGEFFGVIGPNGAGKSTLIKCIATILVPSSGWVKVLGYDTVADGREVRRNIAVCRSGGWVGFDYELSVAENLMFWATINGVARHRVREGVLEALERVGLADKANDSPGSLSSGMRQKMVLAKGLVSQAKVFLLDEPTAGLDPRSAYQIRSLIKNTINKELGSTIIYTSHALQDVETLCDRVCLLRNGKIFLIDRPLDMIRRSSVRVRSLVVFCPRFTGDLRIAGLPEGAISVTAGPEGTFGLRVRVSDPSLFARIDTIIAENGLQVLSSREETPTLEDAFWVLTGGCD